jgi:hypothetical protein
MLRLRKRTEKASQESVQQLKSFFSKGWLGFDLEAETPTWLTFEGGGWHVNVTLGEEDAGTRLNLQIREWDHQLKEFPSLLRQRNSNF